MNPGAALSLPPAPRALDDASWSVSNGFHSWSGMWHAELWFAPASSVTSSLQETHAPGNFHGVEMVKFQSDDRDVVVAFEGRAVTPPRRRHPRRPSVLGADDVLGEVGDAQHRARLRELLDFCHSLGMTHEVGAVGFSIRIAVADRSEPVSIAWVYPPEVRGWIGLTGLDLGVYDPLMQSLVQTQALEEYVDALEGMPDAPPIPRDTVRGVQLSPEDLAVHQATVHEALESLANALAETA